MNEEKLEKIKNNILSIKKNSLTPNEIITWQGWKSFLPIFTEDLEYLFEQAERVQELEEQLQGMHIMYDTRLAKSDEFEKQNKRYREALEEIKKLWERSTDATDDTNLAWKMSCEAHKALEESK